MLGWDTLDEQPLAPLVGAELAKKLAAVDVRTVGQVLEHFPRRLVEQGSNADIETLVEGERVTFIGTVTGTRTITTRTGKRMFTVTVNDGIHQLGVTFFNAFIPQRELHTGTRAMFVGTLKNYRGQIQLSHPDYAVLADAAELEYLTEHGAQSSSGPDDTRRTFAQIVASLPLLPMYPSMSMQRGNSQRRSKVLSWTWLEAIAAVLDRLPAQPDPLPSLLRPHLQQAKKLPEFDTALRMMHFPPTWGHARAARARLAFNEALELQTILALRRSDSDSDRAIACPPSTADDSRRHQFLTGLPFQLTAGQQEVSAEISADLSRDIPMQRLVQGDVGSGKTVVAAAAMLQAVDAGHQAALVAPTEVLAYQHARSLTMQCSAAGVAVSIVALTGSMSEKQRKQTMLDIVSGQVDIVVGTHALFSENVEFFDLACVVIDEQHRFGVDQRDHLRRHARRQHAEDKVPHQLVMTATPIPRTVAMTLFGDLDVSTIRQLPTGRKPVATSVVPEFKPHWVRRAYERIVQEVEAGHQAFIVCPRIQGEGGVEEVYAELTAGPLKDVRVALLHGKLPPAEKDRVMTVMAKRECDVVVSTTVIEVGVDIPDATVMLIREAERFGIATLHQLRGRVGRSDLPSLCLLHTLEPEASDSYQRLMAVAETTDGFELAELDLTLRNAGDVLGADQSGRSRHVRLLNIVKDGDLIAAAREAATQLVAEDRDAAEQLAKSYSEEDQEYLDRS